MSNGLSSRPLILKARNDLQTEWHTYLGRESVVVKDPVALKYFRFEPEEFAILQMLDAQSSAGEVKEKFDRRFAPQRLSFSELQQFVGMLHRNGLLISDAPGQGTELFKRNAKLKTRQWQQGWMNLMSVRFRGFDPDRWLTNLNKYFGWIFSWPMFGLFLLLMAGAISLVATNFDVSQAKLPHFHDFFAGKNWLLLALVMGITKVIHEFGHGLACKRFGGECHEMGFMLLVLTPCLYCNVTDSWMLPNKWKRIAISAAGIYVELVMAALATFVWWYSHPGLVNQLALNVVFVCSVTTLMFNANPLMRYDGYYILSDLVEIPNLRQKASSLLSLTFNDWLLGIKGHVDPFLPTRRRWLFVSYSIASVVYRWVLTFSIFWFLYKILEPYGFQLVGQFLALSMIAGAVMAPVLGIKKFFSVPGRWAAVNRTRLGISVGGVAVLMLLILGLPLPHYVNCPCYLQPQDAESVYVEIPGTIEEIMVSPGQFVEANVPLLRLSNTEIVQRIIQMERETSVASKHLEVVSYIAPKDPEAAKDVRPAEATFQANQSKLEQRRLDLDRLLIRSPRAGFFVSAPPRTLEPNKDGRLQSWSDTPIHQKNIGARLESQTFVGQIVTDPLKVEAVLAIDQAEMEFVLPGQKVRIWVRQLPGQRFDSRTSQVSPAKMRVAPRQLSNRCGGDLQTKVNSEGLEEPVSSTFQVSVPIRVDNISILNGATGIAKVKVGSQTVGSRLWRLLCQTFRFEM